MSAITSILTRGPIPPQIHGILDYPLAAVLIAGPLVLNFDENAATVLALIIGAAAALLAVGTAWSRGIVRVIPPLLHGVLDVLATTALIVLPFLAGFSDDGTATAFYVITGAGGLAATLLTRFVTDLPARPTPRLDPAA